MRAFTYLVAWSVGFWTATAIRYAYDHIEHAPVRALFPEGRLHP